MGRGRGGGGRGRGGHEYSRWCDCRRCQNRRDRAEQELNEQRSSWTEPMGGGDSAGNELTVQFGEGRAAGETRLGDGDRSEMDFFRSENHDHYGRGDGPNNNGTRRGQYTGEGH